MYVSILIIFFVITIFHKLLFPQNSRLYAFLAFLMLGVFLCFRDAANVGVDGVRYFAHYKDMQMLRFGDAIRYKGNISLYYSLSWFASKIGVSFQFFASILSIIYISLVYRFVTKNSRSVYLSTISFLGLGVYVFVFSGLRQMMAMGVFLCAFDAYCNNKKIWTFIWLIIAVLFHSSAIVGFPILLLGNVRLNKNNTYLCILVYLLIVLFRLPLAKLIVRLYNEVYIDYYISKLSFGGTAILLTVLFVLFIICNDNDLFGKQSDKTVMFWMLFLMMCIQVGSSYSYVFTRINLFYMQILMIVVPEIINKRALLAKFGKSGVVVYYISLLLYSVAMCSLFSAQMQGAGDGILHYRFFWQSLYF